MRIDPSLLEGNLKHAHAMADAAAKVTKTYFRADYDIENKASLGFDPVTIADQRAEDAMRAYLTTHCPQDGILGEERENTPSQSGLTWVLDPIDGTRSFVTGLPVWTTLIGLVDASNTPILGVIDQPILGERYIGWNTSAKLVTTQTVPLKTRQTAKTVADAIIATTDPFLFNPQEFEVWKTLQAHAKITRYGLDGYAYATLARGGIDLVVESGLAPHDMAALFAVVYGAGGIITDWTGAPATLNSKQIIAAAHEDLIADMLTLS